MREDCNMATDPLEWVLLRARCNAYGVFAQLREQVGQDVAYMKSVTDSKNDGYSFQFEEQDERFVVQRHFEKNPLEAVVFCNYTDEIRVEYFERRGKSMEFNVVWKWNEQDCKCELLIDDEPHEVWQVSQKALLPLFFPLPK